MDVASLKLCEELHELSGWGGTPCNYHEAYLTKEMLVIPSGFGNLRLNRDGPINHISPAYTLGYLLRKLPQYSGGMAFSLTHCRVDDTKDFWTAAYPLSNTYQTGVAETPEDAAAKLCIELFKSGILERSK